MKIYFVLIFQSHVDSHVNRPVKLIGARRVVNALIIIDQIATLACRCAKWVCSNKLEYFTYVFRMPEHSSDADRRAC